MSFSKLKSKATGLRIRVDLSKVVAFEELESGTILLLDNGLSVEVTESFQTVSNRAAAGEATDAEPAPAVTGL